MRIGFIGLGNAGGKLAGCLLRNGFNLTVRDLNRKAAEPLLSKGAKWAETGRELAARADVVITCLPSPAASATVMEADDGVLAGLREGALWLEMSTTDDAEVKRLGALVAARGAEPLDCPVSGGVHRASTGNISVFVGGERAAFERAMPVLAALGQRIVHIGPLGSASVIKVITNYLASVHLVALGEALTVAKQGGIDLATAFEAIRISSGNSFVHETESQVILSGSYDVGFTMDLVLKDVGLFEAVAERTGVPLEVSPLITQIFRDGRARYGGNAWSTGIVRRIEEACGIELRASGFPTDLVDEEPETPGYEVRPRRN